MSETATTDERWRKRWGLNCQQARFVRLKWGGEPAVQAYAIAYAKDIPPGSKAYQVAVSSASRLLRNAKVKRALEALHESEAAMTGLSRDEKRGILAATARGEVAGAKARDRLRAIALDNLMTGDNKPIKVEGDLNFIAALEGMPEEIEPGAYGVGDDGEAD